MKLKTNINAGRASGNHNSTLRGGLRVKSAVSAGKLSANHNSTMMVAR